MLVDDGRAVEYPGSIDDYIDFILGRNQPKAAKPKAKVSPKARDEARALKAAAKEAEAASARLAAECEALDRQLAEAACARTITDLSQRRAALAAELAAAEARWLEAEEQLDRAAA